VTLLSAGPNWLGSPQHVVGGVALALVVAFVARQLGVHPWVAITLGIGVTSTAEILVELAEYFFTNTHHATAYFDTLADMASTVVGAVIGSVIGAYLPQPFGRRD
jgi:VanZ family protein